MTYNKKPCNQGFSFYIFSRLVQAVRLPPHAILENIYIIDQNFCSFLNYIIFLVQYNFGKVRFINLSDESIHLQVQKRNCQRYPDSRMELVALSGS